MDSLSVGPDRSPSPEQISRWRRRMSPPDNEVPVGVPIAVVLSRTDDVAVAVTGLRVHSTGVVVDLVVRYRELPSGMSPHDLHAAVHGIHTADTHRRDRRLLLGVEYADGRRVSNLDPRPGPADEGTSPILTPTGGGGSERGTNLSFWLAPLPPDGPLTFVLAWPACEIAETHHRLTDLTLTSAGREVTVLWPPVEGSTRPPGPPPPPQLPDSSWFARPAP